MFEITLRETVEADYSFLKQWFECPENNVLFTSELRNILEYKKFFFLMALSDKKNMYYSVLEKSSSTLIGFVALINIDYGDQLAQIWYLLGDNSFRGKGIMTRAVQMVLSKAKQELALHSVHTWVVEDNIASIKVLERNGFEEIGVQREAYFYEKIYKDRILFHKIL